MSLLTKKRTMTDLERANGAQVFIRQAFAMVKPDREKVDYMGAALGHLAIAYWQLEMYRTSRIGLDRKPRRPNELLALAEAMLDPEAALFLNQGHAPCMTVVCGKEDAPVSE